MINSDLISSNYKDFSFERITRKNVSKESYRINNLTSMEIISGKKIALTKILHLASDFSNQINKQDNFDRCFSHSLISEQYSPETIRLPEKFQKAFKLNYSLRSQNSCLPAIRSNRAENSKKLFFKNLVETLPQNEAKEALQANKSVLRECVLKTIPEKLLQTLREIILKVESLENKEEPYSQQDILNIWNLSLQTANTVCRMGLPAAETLSFIERLKTYNQEDSLKKIFARERLEKALFILKKVKDTLSEEDFHPLEELFDKLSELETLQDYSEEQIEIILDSFYELSDLINSSKLSQNDKIKYNQYLGDLFEYQIELLKIFQKLGDYELALENQILNIFREATQRVETLISVFAPVNLSSNLDTFAALEASSALQNLLSINSLFKNLKEAQKDIINQGLQGLSGLASYLGGVWAYFLASTVTRFNLDASEEEIGSKILEKLGETIDFGVTLIAKAKQTVQTIVSNQGDLFIPDSSGKHFVVYKRRSEPLALDLTASEVFDIDPVEINFQFMNRGQGAFLGSFAEAAKNQRSQITEAYKRFAGLAGTSQEESAKALEETEQEYRTLKNLESSSYQENSRIRISELKSLALPSSIASVLIDHYMPKEVDFLEGLYKKLYYSNLGSSVGNDILNAIPGYINSGTFFNFASFVGQQPVVGIKDENTFPGTKESAENRLKSEKEAAQKLLEQTRDGLEAINTQTKLVNEDSKISQEQRAYLTGLLVGYETSLGTIASNLITISNFLDQISLSSPEGKPGTFQVTGPTDWRNNLKSLEEAVVSGLPSEGTRGGMFNVQALIQSDQQSFADMGQTYQLNLQMHLTSMQQEWTVVATSLQVLNQIYLGLARSLLR
ncbi:CT620/CT621 family type III secretion system effector [Chlamydiifrater volucris]|uniref:CT620/CT621 family type III secretion system effector n=1 Tax=Chlamydiifrater volucris TaxID=2681470 RepID=UPI0032B2C69D